MTPRKDLLAALPPRIAWVPGGPPEPAFTFREAQPADLDRVKEVCADVGLPDAVLNEALARSEGVVRLAVRNLRHLAALSVSLHRLVGRELTNDVRLIWVAEAYRKTKVLDLLIDSASVELPEARTRVWVPEHDSWTQIAVARGGGWHGRSHKVGSAEYVRFTRRPVAAVGAGGRVAGLGDPAERPRAGRGGGRGVPDRPEERGPVG